MQDLTLSLVSLVQRTARLERDWLKPRLAERGITLAEFRLVGLLIGEDEGLTQRELAERLSVRGATVSVALRALEDRGVVTRTPDSLDARVKRVKLAEPVPGMAEASRLIGELERESLASVAKRDIATTKRVLRSIVANLEQQP